MARVIATRLWEGCRDLADDTAVAEHALRWLAGRWDGKRPLMKTRFCLSATSLVASRWWKHSRDVYALTRADKAVRRAWDRLVAAGVIVWVKREPLRFNL
jgi:hypothetical protein